MAAGASAAVALPVAGNGRNGLTMKLLTEQQQQQVADAVRRVEKSTDAELVTVLAGRADDYRYISLLWAGLIALLVPGLLLITSSVLSAAELLLIQWGVFVLLALLFRLPGLTTRLVPRSIRYWRASNLAHRQFIQLGLHHTRAETGMLIFVSEAERYVEIIVDRGIASCIDDQVWVAIVAEFTSQVRRGNTLAGFVTCIEACGAELQRALPVTDGRDELPNRLVILP